MADGVALHGVIGDDSAVFVVPAGTRDLRLVSPSFPADGPDVRTLGLVVGSLTIEAASQPSRTVALNDPDLFAGFHEIETSDKGSWRWTDGDAHLAPGLWAGIDGAFILPPPIDDLSPQQKRLANAAHVDLYALIIAFPITGFIVSAGGNDEVHFYGLVLPHLAIAGSSTIWLTLHDAVLPLAFYGVIFLHIGAVLTHHFVELRHGDVRRMLR